MPARKTTLGPVEYIHPDEPKHSSGAVLI